MKFIQFFAVGYTGLFALLGVFSRFSPKDEKSLSLTVLDDICFVQRERLKAANESMAGSRPVFSVAEQEISIAEAVSFSMQLAILQQSVHRANIPLAVPMNVRKHQLAAS